MAKTKTAVQVDQTDDTTEITPHEVLPSLAVVRLTPEQQAAQEIKKFDLPRAWIAQRKTDYSGLKIEGVEDKEGYKKVEAAWQEVRGKRIATEKKREEIKAGYLVIGRAIDGEAKDLVSELKSIEDPLSAELDRIDNVKKEAAAEIEKQIQLKLQNRVSELLENGMSFTGSYYAIGEHISMDVVTLKGFKDDEFADLLSRVKTTNRDILEAKRKKLQDEQDEKDRLQKQKDDQETERLRLKGIQDQIDADNLKMKDRIKALRAKEIGAAGLTFSYDEKVFRFKNISGEIVVKMADVENMGDGTFDAMVDQVGKSVTELKQLAIDAQAKLDKDRDDAEAEKETQRLKQARTTDRERDVFEQFGIRKDGGRYILRSKIPGNMENVGILAETLVEADVNTWANVLNETKKSVKKFLASQEKETKRLADEKESKRLAKMDDGSLIQDILGRVASGMVMVEIPAFKTEAGQMLYKAFDVEITALIDKYTKQAQAL